MVVILVKTNKKFQIVFTKNNDLVLDYNLHDSLLADKWFKKIKHLQKIQIDPIQSELVDLKNLEKIYLEFCKQYDIKPTKIKKFNSQETLNKLHEIYEIHSKSKNHSDVLHKFHHAIHIAEDRSRKMEIHVGWGVKEGPLTETFLCNSYYEKGLKKNNIYLPWAELGRKPLQYFDREEPNEQSRINELCKPHITLRGKFCICLHDFDGNSFSPEFETWFKKYKAQWCKHWGINDWTEKDEYSAPLLATPSHTYDVLELVNTGYKFKHISSN